MFYILTLLFLAGYSEDIKVGIYDNERITYLNFKVVRGTYDLIGDGVHIKTLSKNDVIDIRSGEKITLKTADSTYFASQFYLKGKDYVNHFKIAKIKNNFTDYDDNLQVNARNGRIQLINVVDIDNYVSAVVEGESGYELPLEYYKLQAILSRTYALKNKLKHSDEGFAVCDKVHCQVYHKKCTREEIVKATFATSSMVAVDNELQLINTIFHSNCGGQTCNSEDVWSQEISYLRCIKDTFCLRETNATWQKKVHKRQLNNYFGAKENGAFNFNQDNNRPTNKRLHSVPLTKIRSDFGLRSTYFTIIEKGDSAIISGKGYGHGVGLCQQGGINMARLGYGYVDILNHYYQGIHIINRNALVFFKE